jgi:predicted transcriptional regulator
LPARPAAVSDAEQAQERAAVSTRRVARRLRSEGLTGREIAVVLRVSPQRVSQLLRGAMRRNTEPDRDSREAC